MTPAKRELLTVRQAATESATSLVTLRRHIAKGALKVRRIGPTRRIRIAREDLERYLEQ